MQTNKTGITHRTHIEAYITIWSYRSTCRSCPWTSNFVAADKRFHRTESGYQLEETARSSQENMNLSDSGWYWNVAAHLLGCLHSSWPWKRDATVSEDCALMMMISVVTDIRIFVCAQLQSASALSYSSPFVACQTSGYVVIIFIKHLREGTESTSWSRHTRAWASSHFIGEGSLLTFSCIYKH